MGKNFELLFLECHERDAGRTSSRQTQMCVIHCNNINFCFEETSDKTGGAARVLYYVKKYRKEAEEDNGPSVIYVNTGDNFSANRYNTGNQWKIIADYLNLLRPDAMCLGNHELNVGVENLTLFLQHLEVPVITANINFGHQHTLQTYITPSRVLEIKNHRIGIVGVTTARTQIPSLPTSVSITDEIESLQRECSKLYNSGVNIVIVLSHAGIEVDRLIAKVVEHVDVIVGCAKRYGRQGWQYKEVIKRSDGKEVPIIRDASRMTSLGVFKIEFNNTGDLTKYDGGSMFLHSKIPQDVEALKLQTQDEELVELGVTMVELDHDCKSSECNFANLVADAMIDYKSKDYKAPSNSTGKTKKWTDYPIALINAGAIFRSITKGYKLTLSVIQDSMLYDDTLVLQTLTGQQLVKAILEGTEYHGFSSGYFLQFSGVHVEYNMTKLKVEERLLRIYVRCNACHIAYYSPLERDGKYNIIVNYKTYLNIDTLNHLPDPPIMDPILLGDVVVQYLKKEEPFAEANDRLRVLAEASELTTLPFYLYLSYYALIYLL
ncbi:5prime-nucleotidase, C-terminal domain [Popillia japonica]|uniref:5'-nucleotidase n=1 Tax=Popillia japonica TaxID=7064 RepID=A0AAW1IYD9_POPJA